MLLFILSNYCLLHLFHLSMSVGCLLIITLQKKMHRSKTLISFPVNHYTLAFKSDFL